MSADNPISGSAAVAPTRDTQSPVILAPVILDAVLTPHRSVSFRGFSLLMFLFGSISLVVGLSFLAIGAWPVMGFFGLEVLLLWLAFRANFRSARVREQITVTGEEVVIRCFTATDQETVVRLNPVWLQIETESDPDGGMMRLVIRSHGKTRLIGGFLDPKSRESFAGALSSAIHAAKS